MAMAAVGNIPSCWEVRCGNCNIIHEYECGRRGSVSEYVSDLINERASRLEIQNLLSRLEAANVL
jgi:hypothetical protein